MQIQTDKSQYPRPQVGKKYSEKATFLIFTAGALFLPKWDPFISNCLRKIITSVEPNKQSYC